MVCIPPAWALTASADLPEVSPEDLHGYFELRAEREFSVQVADLRLAHCPYSLPDGTTRATLAAIPAKRIEAVEKMLEAAACRAVSISLALERCLSSGQPMLHFLVNSDRTDLVVTTGDGVAALRSLPGPGGDAPFDPSAFSREVRITLGRLPEQVRRQIVRARYCGTPQFSRQLENELREHLLRMGIESGEPPLTPPDPGEAPGAAVECAERVLREQPVAFEFVVVESNKWEATLHRFNTARGRQIAIVASGLVLLLLVVYGIRSRTETSLDAEWSKMQGTVADLDSLQQRIRQFRPWFEPLPQNLQVIETLVAAFPEKGDVWARSVQISESSKVNCAGFARSQPAMMTFLDRLRAGSGVTALQVQQLRGDNPIQFSVIYKWEAKHDK